jgi:hypothetical protein
LDDISSAPAISAFCARAPSLRGTPRQRPDAFSVAITLHVAAVDVNLTVPQPGRYATPARTRCDRSLPSQWT